MIGRRAILAGLAGLPFAGCTTVLDKPFPEKRSFVLAARRPQHAPAPTNGLVLGIRRFRVSAGYDGRGLVTSNDPLTVHQDFYNEFFAAPGNLLEDLVGTWIDDAGLFQQVAPALGLSLPTHALEGTLSRLLGDYGGGSGQARLDLQLAVIDLHRGDGAIIAQGDYRRSEPLPDRTPDALVAGWDRALVAILTDFEAKLRTGLARP